MKLRTTVRTIIATIVAALALMPANTRAIEGLKLSVTQTNAVLSWPSQTNESFIVQ